MSEVDPDSRLLDEKVCATLVSSIRGIVWEADPLTFRVSFVSPHAERLLGFPTRQWLDEPDFWRNHIHPEDVGWCIDFCRAAALKGEDHEFQYRMIAADGRIVWLHDIVTVVRIDAGTLRLRGVMFDITGNIDISERKSAEQRLKASEERYSILFNNIHDAVIIHDLEGRILDVNQTMLDLYGISLEESRNLRIPEDLSGPGNPLEMFPEICSSVLEGKFFCFEWNAKRPRDGSCFPIEVCLRRITIGDSELILANVRDMTERRRLQDEMIKSQKLESLGMLAGGIAHDFNNILTAILGNLSCVRLQLDPSHQLSKRLDECETAVSRASELTRQLLTFSRGGEPIKKRLMPASLIEDAVTFALRGSNVSCVTELADDLWCLEADEGQLCQVLHNLMLNAAQAMPDGGEIRIRAVNEMQCRDNPLNLLPGPYLNITVSDQGCGIPEKSLIRIFDPYFTTKPKGSGLGLTSAHSIVRRHGGVLEVSSTVGEGSCFTVRLPASPAMRPEDEQGKKPPQTAGIGRILVMDDDAMIREITTGILELLGYGAESCADGREAVERFISARERQQPFSAVILDLTIPGGMGGKEVAPLILEIDPDAVLIVSSGYSNDPVIANYREYGFSGAIPKPFDAVRLGNELKRLLYS